MEAVAKKISILKGFKTKEDIERGFDRFDGELFNIVKLFVLYWKKNKGKKTD